MIFRVEDVIQNRQSKKGYALRLMVSTGFGDEGDIELIHVFSRMSLKIKPRDLIELQPATDANFFAIEQSQSEQIEDLLK